MGERLRLFAPRPGEAAAGVAAAAAVGSLAVGLAWSTYVAGGSDSYCYVSQAEFWLTGALRLPQPVGFTPPWPNAAASLTPTGYIPSATIPGAIAPLCPAGLSLTMALFSAAGGPPAVFLVVPVLGALAVWLAYCLGRSLDRPATGVIAAILLATSPIVLHQVLQPMSDVPAMAWWLAAIVLAAPAGGGPGLVRGHARDFVAGLAASAAVLTRPNLAPLAGVIGLFLLGRPRAENGQSSRLAAAAMFTLGVLPGALLVAWIQQELYGSPLSSGYGSLALLFAWSHVVPNLQRFPVWLLATHTPVVCLALAAPFLARSRRAAWLSLLCLAVAGAVFASYVAYIPYDDWWYLRFVLPAVPLLLALTAAALTIPGARLPRRFRIPLGILVTAALALFFVSTASAKGVFRLREFESRFREAGEYVAARLPERAVVLSVWESGSVRYYGRRLSVTFDEIEPEWLDRVLAFLDSQGRPPYILLEAWEEPSFRARFQEHSRFGSLDWPPMAQVGNEVRLYNPADRARYYAGEATPMERVWPRARGARRR